MPIFTTSPEEEPLHELGLQMAKERDQVVQARKSSGLDDIWTKAREQYQGIDEVNRKGSEWSKARTLDGPIQTTMGKTSHEARSTVFVNITAPYTDAGTARVANILLPTGDRKNWDIVSTPVSEVALLTQLVQEYPQILAAAPLELQELLAQTPEQRNTAIAVAKALVSDALTECNWTSEARKQIIEAGKVGTGVMKGPFPKVRKLSVAVEQMLDTLPLVIQDPMLAESIRNIIELKLRFQPVVKCIPVENLYPDAPSCGTDIHNGRHVWEEIPDITKTSLRELLDDPTYFSAQIAAILREEPLALTIKGETKQNKKSYTIWQRTGELNLSKLLPASEEFSELAGEEEEDIIFCQLEMCNDRIIKITELPLDQSRFPYHLLHWGGTTRQDSWVGIGIPEKNETPQRGLNAAVRAGNDNLGWSVGFQTLMRKGLIEPMPGEDWTVHPYKQWRVVVNALQALGGNEIDPAKAMSTIEFPNHLDRILPWIDYWLRMAEFTTGLPLVLQGQTGGEAVGNNAMAMQNASGNLQMFVKHWDDDNCEPIIQAFYDWVQKYGPREAKGDAKIHALGSSMLIARELQQQALIQLLSLTPQSIYNKSPAKTMDMFLEGLQIDPQRLDLTPEERQRLEAAEATPDVKIQVAQLTTQVQLQIAQMQAELAQAKMVLEAQLKGLSLTQAKDAVETQTAGNIAVEAMKQDHEKVMAQENLGAQEHLKRVDAGLDPTNPHGMPEAPEMSIDQAMNHMGL